MEVENRLRGAESLLDQALADLAGKTSLPPVSQCPVMLAGAQAELQRFAALLPEVQVDKASLQERMNMILRRLIRAQRLLTAASEFYRGWCTAGPAPSYPVPGYQDDGPRQVPALLVFEG